MYELKFQGGLKNPKMILKKDVGVMYIMRDEATPRSSVLADTL